MPRKVRLVPVLRVQGISTGREIAAPIVDDFTGEVIQPVAPAFPPRPLAPSVVVGQAQRLVQVGQAALLLQALGLSEKYKAAAPAAPAGNNKGKQRKD